MLIVSGAAEDQGFNRECIDKLHSLSSAAPERSASTRTWRFRRVPADGSVYSRSLAVEESNPAQRRKRSHFELSAFAD